MKRIFERKKKLARENKKITQSFDEKIFERWGFSYSETDNDQLIDALDYGTDDVSYEDFVRIMNESKKNLKQTGRLGIVL